MKTKHLLLTITLSFIATILPLISFSQAIAAGNAHSLSICNDGTVMAWGANGNGQLGDGTNTSKSTPVQVSGLTGVMAIECGNSHSLALKNDSTVWAWGSNVYGQLGDGTTTNKNIPVQVSGLTGVIAITGGGGFFGHSLALKNDGTVWAWGRNLSGQLGDGTNTDRSIPAQVSGLTGIVAIAGGGLFSLALKNDGTVWAWGWNNSGQLGDGTNAAKNTPVQVSGITGITAIAAGGSHSLALKKDGTMWAWGDNAYGILGDGTNVDKNTPVQVSGLTNIIAIGGGGLYSMALHNNGTAWAWGDNFNGQIGDGTDGSLASKSTPVQVTGLTNITAIAASGNHSLALKNDGTMWAWGSNSAGQLGDGTTTNVNTPVQVTSLCIMTGIKDMDEELSLSVFPNPGSGKFIIEHDNIYRNMRLTVYDILGMPVKTDILQEIQDPTSEIDLSSQPNGVYFLTISSDEGRKTIRVLKL